MVEPKPKAARRGWGGVTALWGVVGLGFWGFIEMGAFRAEPTRQAAPEDPSLGARGACRQFVTRALHDPQSAEWVAGFQWPRQQIAPDHWIVEPQLRARNAFGAMVSTAFRCEVRLRDGNWTLVSLRER